MPAAVEHFWQQLASHGGQPALSGPEQQLSYLQLLEAVDQRCARLQEAGARRVALALDNSLDWVLWDLALLRSGRVHVPLPGFFSSSQQQHVLDSAGIDTLLTPAGTAAPDGFRALRPGLWQRRPATVARLPAGTCKITYTSGTTGQPKGVCLSAGAQLAVAGSLRQACASSQIRHHLCALPLAVLLENLAGIYAQLLAGARIELRPLEQLGMSGAAGFQASRFLEVLHQCRPHSLILLPQLLLALVSAVEQGQPLPDSLRFIAVGGGRVAPRLLERAAALGLPVFEGYGLSECASVVCLNTPEARRPGSVGRPLAHVRLQIAGDGEVLVQGSPLLGYLGEPDHRAPWLASGDLGYLEDGFLFLHGRKKNQFITAFGRNVNPEWVEAELVQQAPIAQAWLHGEAQAKNVAVLVPRNPATPLAAIGAAVSRVNQELPDYARVHHWLLAEHPFTASNGLATTNGRLRRPALFQHYSAAIAAVLQAPERKSMP